MFPAFGRRADGHLYDYEPAGTGGFRSAVDLGGGFGNATAIVQNNVSAAGASDLYFRMGGALYYTAERGTETKLLGSGWDQYDLLAAGGNFGGAAQPDLIAREPSGVLWLYQAGADGVLAAKVRLGTGFQGMDRIIGRADFTGDGKADLITRSTGGTLFLFPGSGNAVTDAVCTGRLTVSAGWNTYNVLISTGDQDGDGKADLIASDAAGALWLFKGTGDSAAPFAARVQIGSSGWSSFNTLF
ncbi:FG-GAP-like repeat-containing protein [Streptomyces sp. RKAG337]|uniref:FG-GAP-like repeat-containing protein n=1 Tax=Streptomyces sp. RKAG337 TaxID=2893404 RepID=UPI002033CB2F|nr:FG-GAP-like repeat-containing protein [Streptomyces sp. RKAG337]MCM2426073.1 FG-GAP-like repeat-containing protein [Streptomyces sp. RKAG337]